MGFVKYYVCVFYILKGGQQQQQQQTLLNTIPLLYLQMFLTMIGLP